jgi:glycosyltransferase involved in cell wall biosynthesis
VRILHVTNIVSHHQLPLARCLAALVGDDNFRFAATLPPISERQNLGWNGEVKEPWILRAGENEVDYGQFTRWWDEADVVICGEKLLDRIRHRLDKSKLTFYMSERWWKPPIGMARLLHPQFAFMAARFRKLASSPLFHFLPMGHYSASDMKRIAPFTGRMWRWGYFTATPGPLPDCDRTGKGVQVLWAGRMLGWKRVDTLIKAFPRFLCERPDATLTLVGDGTERQRLENLARKLLVTGSYHFLPPQPVPEILKLMRQHHIYVLPSTAYEGWGAVVNEAMSEGCAIIATDAAGAPKSVIRHGEHGLLFVPGDWKTLSELLCLVGKDSSMRMRLAQKGQRTIADCWSPAMAAERFHAVCNALLTEQPTPVFIDGPMSAA